MVGLITVKSAGRKLTLLAYHLVDFEHTNIGNN